MALSTLDSGYLNISVDTTYGLAITSFFISDEEEDYAFQELINTHDKGREIQQSWYGISPNPFDANYGGAYPSSPSWGTWPFNPVQAGDSFYNQSTVVELVNNGTSIYGKVIPKDWALNNHTIEGYMETWIEFIHPVIVKVRNKFTYTGNIDNHPVRHQEQPAVFLNNHNTYLNRLVMYSGLEAWRNDASLYAIVPDTSPLTGDWEGNTNTSTEKWFAYLRRVIVGGDEEPHTIDINNNYDQGVGIYVPSLEAVQSVANCVFYRVGGSGTGACSYVAPVKSLAIAANSENEYTFYLTVGTALDIRKAFWYVHGSDVVIDVDRGTLALYSWPGAVIRVSFSEINPTTIVTQGESIIIPFGASTLYYYAAGGGFTESVKSVDVSGIGLSPMVGVDVLGNKKSLFFKGASGVEYPFNIRM